MAAVKKAAAVATMWWIWTSFGPYAGHNIEGWVGPFDTKGICDQVRTDAYNRPSSDYNGTTSCVFNGNY